MPKIC